MGKFGARASTIMKCDVAASSAELRNRSALSVRCFSAFFGQARHADRGSRVAMRLARHPGHRRTSHAQVQSLSLRPDARWKVLPRFLCRQNRAVADYEVVPSDSWVDRCRCDGRHMVVVGRSRAPHASRRACQPFAEETGYSAVLGLGIGGQERCPREWRRDAHTARLRIQHIRGRPDPLREAPQRASAGARL